MLEHLLNFIDSSIWVCCWKVYILILNDKTGHQDCSGTCQVIEIRIMYWSHFLTFSYILSRRSQNERIPKWKNPLVILGRISSFQFCFLLYGKLHSKDMTVKELKAESNKKNLPAPLFSLIQFPIKPTIILQDNKKRIWKLKWWCKTTRETWLMCNLRHPKTTVVHFVGKIFYNFSKMQKKITINILINELCTKMLL